MKETLNNAAKAGEGKPIYINDDGHGVELAALRDALFMVVDIMDACRDEMDDFIEINCGNGMYQGHFMLVKLGLDHAISMINGMLPKKAVD